MRIKNLYKMTDACPSQWSGEIEGTNDIIYIRYRHGFLKIGTGKDLNQAVRNPVIEKQITENRYDGTMTEEELIRQLQLRNIEVDEETIILKH